MRQLSRWQYGGIFYTVESRGIITFAHSPRQNPETIRAKIRRLLRACFEATRSAPRDLAPRKPNHAGGFFKRIAGFVSARSF